MAKRPEKVGLWIIGACGGVGATVALGLAALKARRAGLTGLVTALPAFDGVPLVEPDSIVGGGHEVRSETLVEAVRGLHERAGVFDHALIRACSPALRAVQRNLRPGTLLGLDGPARELADPSHTVPDRTPAAAVTRLADDLRSFRSRHRLGVVVVMNLASCEPRPRLGSAARRHASLCRALSKPGSRVVPASSLYALAAVEAGCPYVNFTPSTGIDVPGIRERADELGVPYAGRDGKTGETLVKSVLAPMFAMRHLRVLSWVGENILGNRDGAVLDDPRTRQAKIRSKDRTVSGILDGAPATHVSIDYVPSLDDWKVAWDFIHFEGFLGARMSMQFTWQGCDSLLAAPLVIDLTRLAALEARRGRGGPMRHLGFFFKDPMATETHDLFSQWRQLVEHVRDGSTG